MRTLRQACAGFLAHEGFFLAGGLAFYFGVCFVPLLFLLVSVTGFVLAPQTVTGQIQDFLSSNVPVYGDELTRALLRIIATRKQSGLLGTSILILFSTQMFAALRFVLNRVLGVRGQPLLHGLLFDTGMVLLVGLLFIGNVGTTAVLAWLRLLAASEIDIPAQWMGRMSIPLAFLLSTAILYVIYRFFPSRSVRVQAAVAGALVASSFWEIAKHLLRLYIVHLGFYDQIYGPLGILMAFVMFAYYLAIVFVFGAEVVATIDPGK